MNDEQSGSDLCSRLFRSAEGTAHDSPGREGSVNVTSVICTYRRYNRIGEAVESLTRQTLPANRFRVLLVDNAPSTPEELVKQLSCVHTRGIRIDCITEPRLGLSYARNAALRACSSDLIAFIDDDAIAHPMWLERLTAAFEEGRGSVGSAGGKVVGGWEAPPPKWLSDNLTTYLSLLDWGTKPTDIAPPRWLAGTNVAYATQVVRNVGGFRTDLGRKGTGLLLSNEEVELCHRIRRRGYRVVYDPTAVVSHVVPLERLTQRWFRQRVVAQTLSDAVMYCGQAASLEPRTYDIAKFLETLPPSDRNIDHLFYDYDDADLFRLQIKAIRQLTTLLIRGGLHYSKVRSSQQQSPAAHNSEEVRKN
jgi:glycosyltransferase involved in cell wall biosynthesis